MPDTFDQLAPWAIISARQWCAKNRVDSKLVPDCVQEALVACWRASKSIDPSRGSYKKFCMCRMIGAIRDYLRSQVPKGYRNRQKKNWRQVSIVNIGDRDFSEWSDLRIDLGVEAVDIRDWVEHCASTLHGRDLLIWLLLSQGVPQRDIAKRFRISPPMVYRISERLADHARFLHNAAHDGRRRETP
jgi:RNA polymerase sigma factor (sigma-70 family)